MIRQRPLGPALLLAILASFAGCGGDDDEGSESPRGGAGGSAGTATQGPPQSGPVDQAGDGGTSGGVAGQAGAGATPGGHAGVAGASDAPGAAGASGASGAAGGHADAGRGGSGGGGGVALVDAGDRAKYRDRLVGLWLAESIANWTGLQTEGRVNEPPFSTDEDWDGDEFQIQAPWGSDDDTDIEFVYVWTMADLGKLRLTPADIQTAWARHTEPGAFIWVSNLAAQELMSGSPAVLPPSTSLFAANDQSLMIDAQLTTEIFGAVAPGMPAQALEIADLPISTTASGYAAHAAQFFVALYSLAPVSDPALPARERILWLVRAARRLVPNESKTSKVIDFVLEDYLANPDADDWERTRDRVAQRFQEDAAENGYRYLEWYESSVNLATGVIALLYGEGDLKRTIQIGTLSGWDSDNGTATMGGLLGLLFGTEYVRRAFPEEQLSTDYFIGRTRVGFNPDTVTMEQIADRLIPLVEKAIREGGGEVSASGAYKVPALNVEALSPALNPRWREHLASMNNAPGAAPVVTLAGGSAMENSTQPPALADGLEFDSSGLDRRLPARNISEFPNEEPEARCVGREGDAPITITVTWSTRAKLTGAHLVEGYGGEEGGWLVEPAFEARVGGTWTSVPVAAGFDPNPNLAFQIHRFDFVTPVEADGLRVRATPGGDFATLCELDGIRSVTP